jgi:hypothetical protein
MHAVGPGCRSPASTGSHAAALGCQMPRMGAHLRLAVKAGPFGSGSPRCCFATPPPYHATAAPDAHTRTHAPRYRLVLACAHTCTPKPPQGHAFALVRARPHRPAMPAAPLFRHTQSPPQRDRNVTFASWPGPFGHFFEHALGARHTHTGSHAHRTARA